MNVIKLTYPPFDNVCSYFVYWDGDVAVLIDCVPGSYEKAMRVSNYLGKTIQMVLLTHGHIDHIHDINKFEKERIKIAIHSNDSEKLYTDKHLGKRFGMSIEPTECDVCLDRAYLIVDGNRINIIKTPGHTAGSVCFEIQGVLFTGDTLFRGSVGRTDFEDGCYEDLIKSIKVLKNSYPCSTLVYPGHGLETTLENECIFNPYFKNL